MVFNPSSDDRLEPGDRLIALAEAPQLKKIERMVRGEI
jgi:K+/H+ antiporter YhaU regulatory subunit KhtT